MRLVSSTWIPTMRMRVIALLALIVLAIVFWDTLFVTPVKLFVVVLHEASHGLAAVLTGGSIVGIEINAMIGGVCTTQGGSALTITSSGYVGSMVFGAAIFLVSLRRNAARVLAWIIAIGLAILAIGYIDNSFGIVFGLAFSAVLAALAAFLPEWGTALALQFLGAVSCLYALVDIKEDLLTPGSEHVTDAAILQDLTGIPALFWGILWGIFALVVFWVVLRLASRELV